MSKRGAQPERRPDCAFPGCQASGGQDSWLCREHQRRLRDRLGEVPELLGDLRLAVSRQAVMAQHAGKVAETPLDWDDRASRADARLRDTLGRLARETAALRADERDPVAPALAAGSAELSRWLARNLHTLVALPPVGEMSSELDAVVRRARAVVDRPIVRSRFVVGPCPELQGEGDAYPGRPCTGQVWALVAEDEGEALMLRCDECPGHWNATQWRRLARRIQRRAAEWLEGELP